jgi:hypothetical protein
MTNAVLVATPFVTLAAAAGAAGTYWYYIQSPEPASSRAVAAGDAHVSVTPTRPGGDDPSRIIYLNREGAALRAGADDAKLNHSSIVKNSGRGAVDIPPFAGTPKAWDTFVQCTREKFAPFAVSIVDRRPIEGSYIMAVVGGKAQELGLEESHAAGEDHDHEVTGLAPFNGKSIANAVVLIFAHSLREDPRRMCETGAMEIAHAYGLDHSRSCKELMSYMTPCGPRSFTNADLACGEHADRACEGGRPTQNSYVRLLEAIGSPSTNQAAR